MEILDWLGVSLLSICCLGISAFFVAAAVYYAKYGIMDTWRPVIAHGFGAAVFLFVSVGIWFSSEPAKLIGGRVGWGVFVVAVAAIGFLVVHAFRVEQLNNESDNKERSLDWRSIPRL